MKSIPAKLMAVTALALLMLLAAPQSAEATRDNGSGHKVTICHATNSAKNPYVKESVDYSAVDGQGHDDHSHHTGPVAASYALAHSLKVAKTDWGDIIPPVAGVNPGQNWTVEGQAIWNNGCNFPTPVAASTDVETNARGGSEGQVLGTSTTAPGKFANTGVSTTVSTIAALGIISSVGAVAYMTRKQLLS